MEGENPTENNPEGEDQNPEMEGEEGNEDQGNEDIGNEEQGEDINIENLRGDLENEEGEQGEEADAVEGEEIEDNENEEGQEVEDSQDMQGSKLDIGEGEEEQGDGEQKEIHSQISSSKGFGKQSEEGEEHSNAVGDDLGESNEDDGEDEGLPPERKIRYRLFKFINRMRDECHMEPYHIDLIANNLAMLYADYLLNNKENEEELNNMAKSLNFKAEFKVSSLDSFIDSDGGRPDINAMAKYMEFADDFYDVQATLIEFEEHCDNILSDSFNKVGIGIALNDMKVVVVDIFLKREVTIDSCNINIDSGNIVIKGELTDEQFGAYALRIVSPSAPNKTIVNITPQHITPANINTKIRPFTAIFNNVGRVLEDPEPKNIEIYIRVKPDLIPYNKIFSDKIRFEDLTLGAIIPLMPFPSDKERKEERRQDMKDEKVAKDNLTLLADYERRKDEEKKRRMKIDGYAYANKGEMDEIQEEKDEDISSSNEESSMHKSSKVQESKANKSKEELSEDLGISGEKSENYEREILDLEASIEKLKEDNEQIQRKINIIYEFRKKEGREEKNFYKESNINESTYADSLTSTAGLYNDLNSHKQKLDQDLKRYQLSIEEQEKRKQDVYEILMKYKEELLDNAETRKGTKIPRAEIEYWLEREKLLEEQVRTLRIQSFTKSLEMNRLKKELKKMEDYFEGLHIIDFEQLKIENNTLTEKIEDRNEEIHKIKIKINDTVQTLAHLQEKSKFISSENEVKKTENENLKKQIIDMKKKLTMKKEENDKKALKQLNANKKIDQINSMPLKNYYRRTLQHIQELSVQIDQVSKQLMVYRQKRKGTKKDITDLLQRKEKMMREFRSLPKMENDL
jgi:hypothetical protein